MNFGLFPSDYVGDGPFDESYEVLEHVDFMRHRGLTPPFFGNRNKGAFSVKGRSMASGFFGSGASPSRSEFKKTMELKQSSLSYDVHA